MLNILWWLGWRPKLVLSVTLFAPAALFILTDSPIVTALGLFVPLALWLRGTMVINQTWRDFLEAAKANTGQDGAEKLGIQIKDATIYTLVSEVNGERPPLIEPCRQYGFTHLLVASGFVGIYPATGYDLKNRVAHFGSGTQQHCFVNISSVDYDALNFHMTTTSGEKLTYRSDPVIAESAVAAIRERLPVAQQCPAGDTVSQTVS